MTTNVPFFSFAARFTANVTSTVSPPGAAKWSFGTLRVMHSKALPSGQGFVPTNVYAVFVAPGEATGPEDDPGDADGAAEPVAADAAGEAAADAEASADAAADGALEALADGEPLGGMLVV